MTLHCLWQLLGMAAYNWRQALDCGDSFQDGTPHVARTRAAQLGPTLHAELLQNGTVKVSQNSLVLGIHWLQHDLNLKSRL